MQQVLLLAVVVVAEVDERVAHRLVPRVEGGGGGVHGSGGRAAGVGGGHGGENLEEVQVLLQQVSV